MPWKGERWEEREAHIWLAAVCYVGKDQILTPFCTFKHVPFIDYCVLSAADGRPYLPINFRGNLNLLIEPQTLSTNYVDESDEIVKNALDRPPETMIVPTWAVRKQFAIIKIAEASLK